MEDAHPYPPDVNENGCPSKEEELWIVDEDVDATIDWKQQGTDETLPLLDLNELWQNVCETSEEKMAKKETSNLCAELQQYLFAQDIPKGTTKPTVNPNSNPLFLATPEQRVAHAKKQEEAETEAEDEKDEGVSGNESDEEHPSFADPYLFKLRFENKKPKKKMPSQSHDEMLELVNSTMSRVKEMQVNHKDIFPAFISAFGLEMAPYFFARLLEALEKGKEDMSTACRSLLYFIAEHADPGNECMTLVVKQMVARITPDNFEGSAFYTMCDLMEIWARILRNITSEQAMRVYDAHQLQDRMSLCVESFMTSYANEEEDSEDPGGLRLRLPTLMVRVAEDLLKRQAVAWEENKYMQSQVTKDGQLLKPRIISVRRHNTTEIYYLDITEKEANKKMAGLVNTESPQKSPEDGIVDDWILTRKYLLSWAFSAARYIFRYFPCPSFEPNGKLVYCLEETDAETVSKMGELLDSLWNVFALVGWQNPVRSLQRAEDQMSIDSTMKCADRMGGNKLEPRAIFCKNTKSLGYSMSAIAAYLFLALRVKGGKGPSAMFEMSLKGTGLDLLEPMYAFNICLPYIMSLMQHSSEGMAMVGVSIAGLLVDRFKRNWSATEVLQLVCGDTADGVDVSVYGFLENLARAFEARNAPDRMMFTFQTLKKCITKIECPEVRFSVLIKMLLSSKRTQIAAQYVTLLKDVLLYANMKANAADDKKVMLAMTDNLRTQFMEIVFPKYYTPRKDYLSLIDPVAATSAAAYFIAASDRTWFTKSKDDSMWLLPGIARRAKFGREYMTVGRECLRAVAAASEHDIKSIPKAKLKKHDCSTHKSIYEAAGLSLNSSVASISMLATALDIYKEVTA